MKTFKEYITESLADELEELSSIFKSRKQEIEKAISSELKISVKIKKINEVLNYMNVPSLHYTSSDIKNLLPDVVFSKSYITGIVSELSKPLMPSPAEEDDIDIYDEEDDYLVVTVNYVGILHHQTNTNKLFDILVPADTDEKIRIINKTDNFLEI